jgi:tRNA (mo5U34)-methyltransferase
LPVLKHSATIDFSRAYSAIRELGGDDWVNTLRDAVESHFNSRRYGDLPAWLRSLSGLPDIRPGAVDLLTGVSIGRSEDCAPGQKEQLEKHLRELHPWRKGPFDLFGLHIDTEWRSDWKWDRLKDRISPLDGRAVLDVGCGNGYHCWRMHGAGARSVLGIDPSPRFVVQFEAVKRYINEMPVHVLPVGIESVPDDAGLFDTVFAMGVLYHRKSPLDFLHKLKGCLRAGGELVLETLVVDGDDNTVLVPEGRYAKMRNVWFIPSVGMLMRWLQRCGLVNVRVADVSVTTVDEQRSTDWMKFESLTDFLWPGDPGRTIEGLPAPKRAILLAETQG